MKRIFGVLVLSLIFASCSPKIKKGYISFFEDDNTTRFYKYGNSYYLEYFGKTIESINHKEYYVKYREYSWGDIDTSYYRKGLKNYYKIDKETFEESILLPVKPKVGNKWMENDGSWGYEVIECNQKFKTRAKKYKKCIKVYCKKLTSDDDEKNDFYFLYYSKKFGYVGNVDSDNKVLSYLNEIYRNGTKEKVMLVEKPQ